MRSFVAIDLDPGLRCRLAELQSRFRPTVPKASWVKPENLHLTLRFLGEAAPELVGSLAARLEKEISRLPRFALHFRGCGVFPSEGRPRVLWVGVLEPPRALFDVQSAVERMARESGFPSEEKPFHPHLTLARFRQKTSRIGSLLRERSDLELGGMEVDKLLLYESRLSDQGSIYRAVAEIPLSRELSV